MSLFYEYKDPIEDFDICVLKIEEDAQLNPTISIPERITNPYRRIQYVTARQALLAIDSDFPLDKVEVKESGKPFVADYEKSFSLSHTSSYAAALICNAPNCGFDIELPGKRLSSIKEKFISEEEFRSIEKTLKHFFPQAMEFILYGLCWSAKESVYKWLGKRGIDFRETMKLYPSKNIVNAHTPYINCKVSLEGEEEKTVSVFMQWQKPIVVTWVLGQQLSTGEDEE